MKSFFVSILILLVLFVASCSNKKCDGVRIITINVGNKATVRTVNECDSNIILSEQEFIKTDNGVLANGYLKEFYSNGSLRSLGNYRNGFKDKDQIEYYINGLIKNKLYYSDRRKVGPQYYFSRSGKIDEVVYFAISDTSKFFTVEYDEKGKMEKLDGRIFQTITDKRVRSYDSLIKGDVLSFIHPVVILDGTKTEVTITLNKGENKLSEESISTFTPLQNLEVCMFSKKFNESGDYEYTIKVELLDSATHKLIKDDSSKIHIKVW